MTDSLEGYEVMDKRRSLSPTGATIIAFIESGNECMGKRCESKEEAKRNFLKARNFINYHGIKGVRSAIRGEMFLLIRED